MKTKTHTTLSNFFEQLVLDNPNQVISTFNDEINIYTIKELNDKANLLAKGFLYNNITKGTPVALVLAGTTNCLTFVLALAKVGATLIPLNKKLDIHLIEKILKTEKVQSIGFYADPFLKQFLKIAPNIARNERGYLNTDKFPELRNIITLGSVKNRGIFTTRELMLLGIHMDDIDMENSLLVNKPTDIFIKKISFSKTNVMKVDTKTHEEILIENFSFPALQNYLLNTI
ncbi:MAG: AMP-binding protein [Prolixibacteraceae bacterium]|jgi:fatty-acyl-CoA synthase|nr:AMP-binding protein [Prolixibacteraceae bacterium]